MDIEELIIDYIRTSSPNPEFALPDMRYLRRLVDELDRKKAEQFHTAVSELCPEAGK